MPATASLHSQDQTQVLVDKHSAYQHIQIHKHPVYGCQLVLDNDLQISSSDLAYQNAMVSPLIGNLPTNSHVAILGGGDGGVLNQLLFHHDLGHLRLEQAQLIDIDEQVVELCQTYLPELSTRIATHQNAEICIADACAFLHHQHRSLHAIIYDLTMRPINVEQSQAAFIQEIFQAICKALKSKGMLSMQICGLNETEPELKAQAKILQQLVPRVCEQFFDHFEFQQTYIPSFEMPWLFLWAKGPLHKAIKNA